MATQAWRLEFGSGTRVTTMPKQSSTGGVGRGEAETDDIQDLLPVCLVELVRPGFREKLSQNLR